MARKIIIVDTSRTMRRILRGMVLANLNDVRILEAEDEADVMRLLDTYPCQLVLYNWDMASQDYVSLAEKLAARPTEARVPLLFLLSSSKRQYAEEVEANGIAGENIVSFNVAEIVNAINRLSNPLQMRRSKRYSISRTHAIISQQAFSFHGAVVNISFGGMLCDMEFSPDYQWAGPTKITVNFEHNGESREVAEIDATVSRLHVSETNPDRTPVLIRIAFRFGTLSENARKVFEEIFARTDRELETLLQES